MNGQRAELVMKSLSAGSEIRFREYCHLLGKGSNDDLFDKNMLMLLQRYAKDENELETVRQYANRTEYSQSRKDYKMVEQAIEWYEEPDHRSFRWNKHYQEAMQIMKKFFRKARLKQIHYTSDGMISDCLGDKSTHSGFTYLETGFKEKGDNLDNIHERFNDALSAAKEEGSFDRPMLLATRTQCSNIYDDYGNEVLSDGEKAKHKTRLVAMVDLLQIINETQFALPVQEWMGSHCEWYAGGKDDVKLSKIINHWRMHYGHWTSLDFSKYDMTLSSWLLEDAFDIVREAFRDDPDFDEEAWNLSKHDFIVKVFIDADGKLHIIVKATASGSKWTSVINSVVGKLMNLTTALAHGVNEGEYECIIMGDDNLIFTKSDVTDSWGSYIEYNFGVTVNVTKSTHGTNSDDPEFLSRLWTVNGPYRNSHMITCKLLFPERFRTYKDFSPEIVFVAYILAYGQGMYEMYDINQFWRDYPSLHYIELKKLRKGQVHLPGYLGYAYKYGLL